MKLVLLFFLLFSQLLYSEEKKVVIGYSVQKRPIYLHQFGSGRDLLFVIAGIHGNEENTETTARMLIDRVRDGKVTVPSDKSLWILPSANPDGLYRGRRINANNVDLNRNFKTDGWKNSYMFFNTRLSAGKFPFSEPETKALHDLFNKIKGNYKIVVLSLHSAGDALIPGTNSFFNKNLAEYLMANSSYINNSVGYNAFGDLTLWLSNKLNIASITVEFKSKKKPDINNLQRMVLALFKIEFMEKIYKNNFDFSFLFKSDADDNLDAVLNGLPKDIVTKIKSDEEKKSRFMETLKKIETDDDLLLYVNKNHPLSDVYIPDDLVVLSDEFSSSKKSFQLRKVLLPDLKEMYDDAKKSDANLKVISAYRSYNTQKVVFNGWVKKFGEKEARRVSAEPGFSQHQLGTAIDFNELDESFENTKEGIWLLENSYKYGFVLSFPKGKEDFTGFKYEPWHYRYIGKDAACLVHDYFNNSLELFLSWYWSKKVNSL